MNYLSVCSGIEAATVAWHPLGWQAVAYSEIERFPSEVLAHHYPQTPNLGDMTKFKEWTNVSDVDVLVGGTPCQSFSVAGLRKGLDDPRGNLMLTYLAIADKYRPRWLVWENVPGVLSSNAGQDFGTFLGGLGELGYGFAYRVLDAQYFGVAQRRRRVFVVGCLGDWRLAAAVLFERHSLSGHPAPSREKRQSVTASTRTGASVGSLCARTGQSISVQDAAQGHLLPTWPAEISSTLDTTFGTKMGLENQHVNAGCPMFVPAQPIALAENTIGRKPENGGNDDGFTDGGPMYTLNATGVHGVAQPIPFDTTQITSKANYSKPQSGDPCHPLAAGAHPPAIAQPMAYNIAPGKGALKDDIHVTDAHATKTLDASGSNPAMHQGGAAILQPISFSGQMSNPQTDVDMTQTLQAKNPMAVAVAVGTDIYNGSITGDVEACMSTSGSSSTKTGPTVMQSVVAPTLTAANDPSRSPQSSEVTQQVYSVYQSSMAVRRLSPKECERLQGFPDNYTDIKSKNKPTPDGPRYKALGNSMAVPVMAWIGQRIKQVEQLSERDD